MDSKFFFSLFLVISPWVSVGLSQDLSGLGAASSSMPCMQKLLPCEPYLHSSSPPSSCCQPLKEMVSGDAHCLCAVFNDAAILKSLNVTQTDALNLTKACGANADISVCKNAATTPTGSPTTPGTSTPTTPSTGSSSGTSRGSETTKSSAYGIYPFAASGFIAFFVALIVSAIF